jgi:hypothetical protein
MPDSSNAAVKVRVIVRGHDQTTAVDGFRSPHGWVKGSSVVPVTSFVDGVCQNVPEKIFFTISHDGKGVISSVSAEVYYTDIASPSAELTFTAAYIVATATDAEASGALGDAQGSSIRSGAPGYLAGRPVLSGRLSTDGPDEAKRTAIAERVGGLTVTGMAPGGGCAGGAKQVGFGYDTMTACVVSLTAAELMTACLAQVPSPLQPRRLLRRRLRCARVTEPCRPPQGNDEDGDTTVFNPFVVATEDTYFGIFGDASSSFLDDWVRMPRISGGC